MAQNRAQWTACGCGGEFLAALAGGGRETEFQHSLEKWLIAVVPGKPDRPGRLVVSQGLGSGAQTRPIEQPMDRAKPVDGDTVFALSEQASLQSMGDGAVILLANSGQLYTCNETAEFFLKNVDGQRTFGEVLRLFIAEFDVDEAIARADLAALSNELMAEGVLKSV
jgi:pyrroloquinoline quinone biosynthesis protein D